MPLLHRNMHGCMCLATSMREYRERDGEREEKKKRERSGSHYPRRSNIYVTWLGSSEKYVFPFLFLSPPSFRAYFAYSYGTQGERDERLRIRSTHTRVHISNPLVRFAAVPFLRAPRGRRKCRRAPALRRMDLMIARHTRAARSRSRSRSRALTRRARVNAFVRMHSRSCGHPPSLFLSLFISLSLLAPPSRGGVPLLALCNCVPRTPVRLRTRAASRRRRGAAWRGVAWRQVGPGDDEHVIESARIRAVSEIRFASAAPYASSFLHFSSPPFRSGVWIVRRSRFQRGSMR